MPECFHDTDAGAEPLASLRLEPLTVGVVGQRWARVLLPSRPVQVAKLVSPGWESYQWMVVVDEADDSQFDRILAEMRENGEPPTPGVAIALAGKKFHGYRGRPWLACRGNLHLSAVFPIQRELGPSAVALAAIPAVAVLDALHPWVRDGFRPGIKWVNDILWHERKISGVITSTQGRGPVTEAVVFGIGLNLAVAPEMEPNVFVPGSACLCDALGDQAPSLGQLFAAVAIALANRVSQFRREGSRPILEAYRSGSILFGEPVRVWDEATVNEMNEIRQNPAARRGVVEGINDDLSIRLAGDPRPVSRGRLALETTCRALGL